MSDEPTRECHHCDGTMELDEEHSTARNFECPDCGLTAIEIKDEWSLHDTSPEACPACETVGNGDDVLVNDQRWCSNDDCRVVSYHAPTPDTE